MDDFDQTRIVALLVEHVVCVIFRNVVVPFWRNGAQVHFMTFNLLWEVVRKMHAFRCAIIRIELSKHNDTPSLDCKLEIRDPLNDLVAHLEQIDDTDQPFQALTVPWQFASGPKLDFVPQCKPRQDAQCLTCKCMREVSSSALG